MLYVLRSLISDDVSNIAIVKTSAIMVSLVPINQIHKSESLTTRIPNLIEALYIYSKYFLP